MRQNKLILLLLTIIDGYKHRKYTFDNIFKLNDARSVQLIEYLFTLKINIYFKDWQISLLQSNSWNYSWNTIVYPIRILSIEGSVKSLISDTYWISLDERNELTENVGPTPRVGTEFFTVWIKEVLCKYDPFCSLKLFVWL